MSPETMANTMLIDNKLMSLVFGKNLQTESLQ